MPSILVRANHSLYRLGHPCTTCNGHQTAGNDNHKFEFLRGVGGSLPDGDGRNDMRLRAWHVLKTFDILQRFVHFRKVITLCGLKLLFVS